MIGILNKLNFNHLKSFIDCKHNQYLIKKEYSKYKRKRKIFLIGTPMYGNLGDQAIITAEIKFIEDNFKGYELVEVSLNDYYEHLNHFSKYINTTDIIMLHGGGNLGNEYLFEENIRRSTIESFPNNRIVLFPQTMYFTDNKELNISKNIYNKHKHLTLVAREKKSYEIMNKEFDKCNIILTPDIVLYLNNEIKKVSKWKALNCLRDDLESKLTDKEKQFINNQLQLNFKDVLITDTVIKGNVDKDSRQQVLNNKLNEFRESKLVITDRIHGMIFAAITGTPCIALSNYNYKVKGTYEWIKHLGYIKFTDDIKEIPKLINELKDIGQVKYDNSFAIKEYKKIIDAIVL